MSKITYSEAFTSLEKIVSQLEDDGIQLDTLAEKVKEATDLIKICESRLKKIENEVKSAREKT
jgi:exodeoxyribonuclease VII small subunit